MPIMRAASLSFPSGPTGPLRRFPVDRYYISVGLYILINTMYVPMGPLAVPERPGIGRLVVFLLAMNGISGALFALVGC